MKLSIFTAILLCITGITFGSDTIKDGSAPIPASFPDANVWQLDLELHGDPSQISLTLPGEEKARRFWYMVYTITNNSNTDIDYYPVVEVLTNTFKLYEAGKVPVKPVFQEIKKRYADSVPLLERELVVAGKILQGIDNARDCVLILDDFDPNATSVKVFIKGLSNETAVVEQIDEKDEKNNKKYLLQKTLMLEYSVPGDQFNQDKKVMLFNRREWIMR
ncbi:MAG: hypothetical protein JW745_00630 [Sedimentisphaerales bacterium]|nr:hypothetical protein [Sedimentisphaerales bacterium]MBN2843271.1 hypothetical protein [Sedimentisphaerales bacterium]